MQRTIGKLFCELPVHRKLSCSIRSHPQDVRIIFRKLDRTRRHGPVWKTKILSDKVVFFAGPEAFAGKNAKKLGDCQ